LKSEVNHEEIKSEEDDAVEPSCSGGVTILESDTFGEFTLHGKNIMLNCWGYGNSAVENVSK
jgi:hypothetical protein